MLLAFAGCAPGAYRSGCSSDEECAPVESCHLGVCRQSCGTTDDCVLRRDSCQNGVCLPTVDSGAGDLGSAADREAAADSANAHDAGFDDAGVRDAARPDSALPDAARADSVRPDSRQPDTTPVDDFCRGGDVVLREPLIGSIGGAVSGGSVTGEGWRTNGAGDQISWDLGTALSSGSIEFEARGFHADVGGCFWGVCYYVGLFEEANGDKRADYTGSAFIESRFHNNQQENFHDTIKLQAGDGDGSMQEPMIPPGLGWSASQWHRFSFEWGGGRSRLYLDGTQRLTASYDTRRAIGWRYLFLGTTNYKGMDWGATGVTYRDLCVRR